MPLIFKGYLKTSLIEWPGKIAAVLFLPGCNFRCSFCHNSDLVLRPDTLESIKETEVIQDLKNRKNWIDGISITGGEPTLQKDLVKFIRKVIKSDLLVMLETNGTNPDTLKQLFNEKLLDFISMDLKGPLDGRYGAITGVKVDLNKIKESMSLIRDSGVGYEFRTTVVPGLHSRKDLLDLAKEITWAQKWFLQQFVPHNTINPELTKTVAYSKKEMDSMQKEIRRLVHTVRLRGL